MYQYDINEILYLMECHYLSGMIEGLETANHLTMLYDKEKLQNILHEIIEITWDRKYILCKARHPDFLKEDSQSPEASLQPASPSESASKTTD